MLPNSLRKSESEAHYQDQKKRGLTVPLLEEKVLIRYKHWVVIANRFPYDLIFREHDMIVPRREFANRAEMTFDELSELWAIIDELVNQYDLVFENLGGRRSIANHYHVHLANYIRREDIEPVPHAETREERRERLSDMWPEQVRPLQVNPKSHNKA